MIIPKTLRERVSVNWYKRIDIDNKALGRRMTAREVRLDMECEESPEPSVIYADVQIDPITEAWLEFTAVTIVSRSE